MKNNIVARNKELRCISNLAPTPLKDNTGRWYSSAEHMYQTWKTGQFDIKGYRKSGSKVKADIEKIKLNSIRVMIRVMTAKFEQHPEIQWLITGKGGVEWLEKCHHYVNGKDRHWECIDGKRGAFMNCLIQAYIKSMPCN